MPRLPSARDVQTVSPRVASDPGVSAPVQAFESPLGTAAQELAPAVEVLAQVARKQENRDNAVNLSGEEIDFERDGDLELGRLNTKADLTDKKTLASLGQFLSERKQAAIERHREQGGSRDSLALLTVRLNEAEAKIIGRASAASVKIGQDKVKAAFGKALAPIIGRVSTNPSLETINEATLEIEDRLTGMRAGLDPSQEETFRRTAREQIALSAVDTLIIRGHVETAESLLEDGGLSEFLGPDKQREVRRKIETVVTARDDVLREIAQAETILRRPLTQEELMIKLGLASKQALTERQRRTDELIGRGLSPELAQDIAAKDVVVIGPDKFGNFYSVNRVTNESNLVVGKDAQAIDGIVAEAKPKEPEKPEEKPTKLEQAVTEGTGPFSAIQAGISNVIGPFVEGTVFEDTTDARQAVRLFTQTAKTGLINNPKFPVAEQNIVAELLPDPDKFFVDPDRSKADLKKLKEFLTDSKESKTNELNKGKITTERKGELTDQISRIDELLSLMEVPGEESEPEAIAEGTIIRNRTTGERMIRRGGKWEPHGE